MSHRPRKETLQMGYTTCFDGCFSLNKPLATRHRKLLDDFLEEDDRRQWVPTEDGTAIMWDEGPKFYNYVDHLKELIKWLARLGYKLNGSVIWNGERYGDVGTIWVLDNVVKVIDGPAFRCERLARNIFGSNDCQQCKSHTECFPEVPAGQPCSAYPLGYRD
jgi:hypothetical protein